MSRTAFVAALLYGASMATARPPLRTWPSQEVFAPSPPQDRRAAQGQAPAADESLPRVERLSNGLSILIVEDHALPLVSVQLWYRAGSRLDPPETPGVALAARRMLEHHADAALRLRALGARCESATLRDASYFASLAPRAALEPILTIEAQRMAHAAAPGDDTAGAAPPEPENPLAADQPVAGNANLRAGSPEGAAATALLARLFAGHPYTPAQPAARSPSHDDVGAFVQRWCVVGNATLVIIGDVAGPTTLDVVRQLFGGLPWKEPPLPAEGPLLDDTLIEQELSGGGAPGVWFGWLTPGWAYFENTATDALLESICDPRSGSLAAQLRESGAAPPRWTRFEWRDHGALLLFVPADAAQHAAVRQAVTDALDAAPARLLEPSALHGLRAGLWQDAAVRQASFAARATLLGMHEIIGGDALLSRYDLPRTERIGARDVGMAALRLSRERRVVLRCLPGEAFAPTASAPSAASTAVAASPRRDATLDPLDASAALELLASAAGNANLDPRVTPRPTIDFDLSPRVRLVVCPLTGYPQAAVRTVSRSAPADAVGVPAPLADYARHHGMQLDVVRAGERVAAVGTCRTALVPQMLELQRQCLPPTGERVSVVVAEVDPAALAEAVRTLLVDAATSPAAPPAAPADAAREEVAAAAGDGADPHQVVGLSATAGRIALQVEIPLTELAPSAAARETPADELAWLIGAASSAGAGLDHARCWRWTCDATPRDTLLAKTTCSEAEAAVLLERLRSRVGEIREGRVPPLQRETARRLAKTSQGLALDGPESIARHLADAEARRRWPAGQRAAPGGWRLTISGASRELAERLARFGHVQTQAP